MDEQLSEVTQIENWQDFEINYRTLWAYSIYMKWGSEQEIAVKGHGGTEESVTSAGGEG